MSHGMLNGIEDVANNLSDFWMEQEKNEVDNTLFESKSNDVVPSVI